jgi:hypothetical protein
MDVRKNEERYHQLMETGGNYLYEPTGRSAIQDIVADPHRADGRKMLSALPNTIWE